jgi:hypothetical protein
MYSVPLYGIAYHYLNRLCTAICFKITLVSKVEEVRSKWRLYDLELPIKYTVSLKIRITSSPLLGSHQ